MNASRRGLCRGFTLIELLIVVAIIAILALIAVPNFLEAQARAKVSRAMTDMRTLHTAVNMYQIDWNEIIWDGNDAKTPPRLQGWSFFRENPGIVPDVRFIGDRNWMATFYCYAYFAPLTTPVAYITYRATDTFSHVVPIGLDTREINQSIVYWVLFCAGPDIDDGDWFRGNSPNNKAIKYDPTNGTVSSGDIWRGEAFTSQKVFVDEYGVPM